MADTPCMAEINGSDEVTSATSVDVSEAGGPTGAEWQSARARFKRIQRGYEDLLDTHGMDVSHAMALVFLPLSMRYFNGERSRGLYDEMMAVRE